MKTFKETKFGKELIKLANKFLVAAHLRHYAQHVVRHME